MILLVFIAVSFSIPYAHGIIPCGGWCRTPSQACDKLANRCRIIATRYPLCIDSQCARNAVCNNATNMCVLSSNKTLAPGDQHLNTSTRAPEPTAQTILCSTDSGCVLPWKCDKIAGKCRNTKTYEPSCENDCPPSAQCDRYINMCATRPKN